LEASAPRGRLRARWIDHDLTRLRNSKAVDPGSVMDQLGHADPAFTLRIYRHGMRRDPVAKQRLWALVERDESK
jgi:integrase